MRTHPTTRPWTSGPATAAGVVWLALSFATSDQAHSQEHPGERQRAPVQRSYAPPAGYAQPRPSQTRPPAVPQPHLGEWMNTHRGLPLDQQQRALEQEPGFRQLRPDVQQHMRDRLTQLNNMSPERRQQAIARTEAMERLNPQQRQQVRSAAGELGSLPEDRRRAVARAFHDLRNMPDPQRQSILNSPQFRGQFNDQERGTLNHLFTVAPYLPLAPHPAVPPPQF